MPAKTIARRNRRDASKRKALAGLRGAETVKSLSRMDQAKSEPCVPGTCRASNGVTLALPGQADLYGQRIARRERGAMPRPATAEAAERQNEGWGSMRVDARKPASGRRNERVRDGKRGIR